MTANRTFDEKLAYGKHKEHIISIWKQSQGAVVLPATDIEQHTGLGPRLLSGDGDIISPDLLSFDDGVSIWLEVKGKEVFTWYRILREWQTGIDRHSYDHYKKAYRKSSIPVHICFLHSNPNPWKGDLKYGCPKVCPIGYFSIDMLNPFEHYSEKHGRSGMVYWSHSDLVLEATIPQLNRAISKYNGDKTARDKVSHIIEYEVLQKDKDTMSVANSQDPMAWLTPEFAREALRNGTLAGYQKERYKLIAQGMSHSDAIDALRKANKENK